MLNKKVANLLFISIVIFVVPTLSIARTQEDRIADTLITLKVEKKSVDSIFRFLMTNCDIAIGFEESIFDRGHRDYEFTTNRLIKVKVNADGSFRTDPTYARPPVAHSITINVKNERLENVLDQIVAQMMNYDWEINDGVVNIFPSKGRDERFARLLELTVNRFTFEKGKTVKEITKGIWRLPELGIFLAHNDLFFEPTRPWVGATFVLEAQYGRTVNVEIDFSNVKFRELLNKITKAKKGGWSLRWGGKSDNNEKEYIDIDI